MHHFRPRIILKSPCFYGWKWYPPPIIIKNIRSSTTKAMEVQTKTRENELIAIASEIDKSANINFRKYGLMLSDHVNSGELDIDMAKNVHGWQKFGYDNEGIPEELRKIRQEKGPGLLIDQLESLVAFSLELDKYRSGSRTERQINSFADRLWRRFDSDDPFSMLEYDINNFGKDEFSEEKSFICRILKSQGYNLDELIKWTKAVKSQRMIESFESMEGIPFEKWPRFLTLFTLRRRCDSRQSAYKCLQLFQQKFNDFGKDWQVGAFIRTLRICQYNLLQYLPVIVKIFVLHADDVLRNAFTYNQLLWLLAHFGTNWKNEDAKIIIEAQRSIVIDMAKHSCEVDTKGYLSLAYTAKDLYPERAKDIVNVVKLHDYAYSEEETRALKKDGTNLISKFPYTNAVYAMDLLLTKHYTEALKMIARFPTEIRQNSTMWGILIMNFYHLRQLDQYVLRLVWDQIRENNVQLTSFLVQKILMTLESKQIRTELLEYAESQGLKNLVNSQNARFFLNVRSRKQMNEARILLAHIPNASIHLFDNLIKAEKRFQPASMWKTYSKLLAAKLEPTETTLLTMCMAASGDISLMWDGMYATQRCVVEFKNWVKGADEEIDDSHDPFKIYPSQDLFYRYIRMLGRANYALEIQEILPWMARINFHPKKTTLCAIIMYSRDQEFLLRHAEKVKGEWPTAEELEQYELYNRRE